MRKTKLGPREETRSTEFSWALSSIAEYELQRQRLLGGIR